MSRRKKHLKQEEVRILPNVFHNKRENFKETFLSYFSKKDSFTLELGCGYGEYTLSLAKEYPEQNFVGLDRAGARIWAAGKKAIDLNLNNVAFLLTYVEQIAFMFERNSVDEIWLPFPNPLPIRRKMKKILTSPRFLDIYKIILKPEGRIHLKTDDEFLFDYTKKTIKEFRLNLINESRDIYLDPPFEISKNIVTRFEAEHLALGKKIKYICFTLK